MMKLYIKECRRIVTSMIYFLFLAVLVFHWFQGFRGVTRTEIDWAEGITPAEIGFERSLLSKPSENEDYFGSKISEDNPDAIMTGVTRKLLSEYESNRYATYPLGYYKAVALNADAQDRVLEILCEITGLTEEQLKTLPEDYFPATTGTIISFDAMRVDENGNLNTQMGNTTYANEGNDKTKHFLPQVTYDHFKELMQEMEGIIGENGSQYSEEMMITYFGISDMTYEEACTEYEQTILQDKVTGGFARLFCDDMGLALGLYPVFLVVLLWLKDRMSNATELIYSRKVSSIGLVLSRYLASITMVLIPVVVLSLESLIPLICWGVKNGISVDCFAYIEYICWWLLPTVMAVCAVGMFFTLLTDSPIAIVLQFLWWFIDKGVTGLSGDTRITTLMVRHNTLRGYEIIQDGFEAICMNRASITGVSVLLVILSVWILVQKRKGKINAANIYGRCLGNFQNKFSFSHKK